MFRMMAGQDVPDFVKYLQLGDYRGTKEVYLCFGCNQGFAAAGDSIKKRLEVCGCKVTYEIREGSASKCAPFPKDDPFPKKGAMYYFCENGVWKAL